MRKRQSRLIQTLYTIEDLLIIFSDYFDKNPRKGTNIEDWLYAGIDSTSSYFVKKGILNPDLSFKQKPDSILKLIKKPWDKKWRFILFDIPTEHNTIRNIIRRRLKEWDFKFFQRSVWFSPLPLNKKIKELDKQIGDTDYLTVIEGRIGRINPKELVKEKWEIEKWQEKARDWNSKLEETKNLTKSLQKRFWDLIIEHPKVPQDLLPQNWPLEDIFETFIENKFDW
jgi:DNA-binding transcriptional regulator PaaX